MDHILLLPLVPAAIFFIGLLLPRSVRNRIVILPAVLILGLAFLSILTVAGVYMDGSAANGADAWQYTYTLGSIDGWSLDLLLRLDALAAVMLVVVTVVGAAVAVYSLAYMRDDERIGWYYQVLSLFIAAMLLLVLSGDLLLFFMSWEVMGLCSYLLIGFWYEKREARNASIKAFLMTKVGDTGFAIALAVVYLTVGSFDFATIFASVPEWSASTITLVSLLVFFGAMGKSAQFPLHSWLPDAMVGPTPASALIHAATMVAAGVFLIARMMPVVSQSPEAMSFIMIIAAITALMSALIATTQYDIKRVLAFSTISQLGYMFLGLMAGGIGVGMFHLMTHAFFKSLLFLGAGSLIHAYHTQDMREMGGASTKMKLTTVAFTVGTLALMGVPPFSGFFSKDAILESLWLDGQYVIFSVALVTAALTSFYMVRLWLRVFPGRGEEGTPQSKHAHESEPLMFSPMLALAAVTVVAGFMFHDFGEFLSSEIHAPTAFMAAFSIGAVVVGAGAAWALFGGGRSPSSAKDGLSGLHALLYNRFYLDTISDSWIAQGYSKLSEGVNWFDKHAINGAVNGTAVVSRWLGDKGRLLQNGNLSTYQRVMVTAVLILVFIAFIVMGG